MSIFIFIQAKTQEQRAADRKSGEKCDIVARKFG